MKQFKNIILGFAALFLFAQHTYSQNLDYFRVMQYNLMYYRQTTTFCTGSNNDATKKDAAFKKIVKYNQPDLIICNEVGSNLTVPSRILDNVLNTDGETKFKQCGYSNNGSDLVNMLFYNSEKFELKSQTYISKTLNNANIVRVIDVYTLFYNDENLTEESDTTFIHVIAAHLKAGNTSADETERGLAAQAVMDYLETNNLQGNIILAGDLNTYSASEDCYQHFTNWGNTAFSFTDPVNASGNWSNNATFAFYHTQSTHSSTGGCHSGGGMDDRFDHILVSDEIMNQTTGVKYIANSYKALGQDGNRFNQSVIFPQNNSVPIGIDTALYVLSDHLPVQADFSIKKLPVSTSETQGKSNFLCNIYNLPDNNYLIQSRLNVYEELFVAIYNVAGQKVMQTKYNAPAGVFEKQLSLKHLNNGVYLIKIQTLKGQTAIQKVLKL